MTRIMERQDVGMLEPGEEPNLPDEAKLTGLRFRVRVQYFERNAPVVPDITGKVDGRECALTDLALDIVPAGECYSKRGERVLRNGGDGQISLQPGIPSPEM